MFGFLVSITHNSISIIHNSKIVGPMTQKLVWISITLFPVFVSITQFSDFWVMSYGNWKHILAVFSFHDSVFNCIFVIKHTWKDPLVRSAAPFDIFFFCVNSLFVPTFWGHFYFGPYISILPLFVLNPINACYLSPFLQPTDGNGWRG